MEELKPDSPYKTEKDKKLFYCSPKWEKLRLIALKRDNYECQECKRQGRVTVDSKKIAGEKKKVRMNVHHIKELEDYPELALDLDNLETLCIRCHNSTHGKEFKLKRKEKRWQDEWW
ncbi:HNH endonuclease [Planococcus massiliensis]|uniref:Putative HNH nuclease YajD n=1 Tax=Planococcus massiliensis TaxID=1499687 RepID=A0A098EMW8_9BACL|nr:HNH endonuclease [Planococcus massiliensis]CEG23137.1 HNH endonuclease [Planococcus massiliensis]